MRSTILLSRDGVICNHKFIAYNEIDYRTFGHKQKIIILDEELYTRRILNSSEEEVQQDVKRLFGENNDFVYDYFTFNKKRETIVYAIKGLSNIRRICENAYNVEVEPIQLIAVNNLKRKYNKFNLMFVYNSNNYYVSYNGKYITSTIVDPEVNIFMRRVEETIDDSITIIDKRISNRISFNIIDAYKEVIDDKKIFKQRFFTT
ncbi:hypothetical protein KQI77_05115 [Clostridium sp. MSJ-8]|uniref:hypothetical protein n=1 Tax=Clostridium sp. MSJ-8 TaxID=2841510 RepID=UPI001C0ECDC2|nr:hypothetical protein [Clostridium sp. MSJ-8]MBU5487542.1 hypothetical protein [Clostridium sp. MSJ-8]